MYAPFGAGILIGPRRAFGRWRGRGPPRRGAVDRAPEREEAGSPNVIGAVALHAAIDALTGTGWPP